MPSTSLPEAALVRESGQLVDGGLPAQAVVQVDVLHRDGGLLGEVAEQRALLAAELLPAARHREDAVVVHEREGERRRVPVGQPTSRAICVTLAHPSMRMMVRNVGASSGTLTVYVLFEDLLGRVQSAPIGVVASGREWAPTLPMALVANPLALLPGGNTPVAFRFVPQGEGSEWRIDGVHVDPYCKR